MKFLMDFRKKVKEGEKAVRSARVEQEARSAGESCEDLEAQLVDSHSADTAGQHTATRNT
ncbi:MAG TPA: hypothetical protein DCE41_24135 [Cytophagales bacterium]|nr:hypothetical protein [Cytophagales bacterium]HAA17285.1 hypothetical protein [Cytophagales bacterium]HAP64034.1 hypothetical protein [Cytophagales bacterium]